MRIIIKRVWKKSDYTIGRLSINGIYFCDTLENTDRGLKKGDSIEVIKNTKILGKTAIPIGTYSISLNIVSPKFNKLDIYKNIEGKLPRLLDVPGFDGILIHIGNHSSDTNGCILVGLNTSTGKVLNSALTFFNLYTKLQQAVKRGELILLKIE